MKTYGVTIRDASGKNERHEDIRVAKIDNLRAKLQNRYSKMIPPRGSIAVFQWMNYGNVKHLATVTRGPDGLYWGVETNGHKIMSKINADGSLSSKKVRY